MEQNAEICNREKSVDPELEKDLKDERYFKCERLQATIMVKHCATQRSAILSLYQGDAPYQRKISCAACNGHKGKKKISKAEFHAGITLSDKPETQFTNFDLARMGVGGLSKYGR